jgi:hypothetical protein
MTNKQLAQNILATLDDLVFKMYSEPLFNRGDYDTDDEDDEPEYPGLIHGAYDKAVLKITKLLDKTKGGETNERSL